LLLSDPEDLGRFVDELAACRRRGQRPAGPVDDGESGGRFDLVEHLRQGAGAAVVEDAGCCGDVVVAGDAGDQLQPAQCSFAHGDRAHRRGRERGQVQVALRAWRKRQAEERLAWGSGWTDTGLVFTREDGTALSPQWVSVRFESLAYRSGLPAIRFHDLRHGAASLSKAARQDTKIISELLGHHRTSFTDDVYVHVFPDVAKEAAEARAAVVPRRPKAG